MSSAQRLPRADREAGAEPEQRDGGEQAGDRVARQAPVEDRLASRLVGLGDG